MTSRHVTIEDAKDLFEWKNDPQTRKFAIATHEKIKWEDHLAWLKHEITGLSGWSYIYESEGRKLGTLRVSGMFPPYEIAIRIAPEYRGLGIATRILEDQHGTAKIVEGNIASMRAFAKAGFLPIAYEKGVYTWSRP